MGKKRVPQKKKPIAKPVAKPAAKPAAKSTAKPQEMIVDEANLNWKPVDIPDTLGDFGGFYGLEEIDGVDVKIVNGKVNFVAKNDSKVVKDKSKEKTESKEKNESKKELEDVESVPGPGLSQIQNPNSWNSRIWMTLRKES